MLNKTLTCLLLVITITSCKKGDNTPAAPKNIERLVIGPEIPVQLKGREFYIGVQYIKDYAAADEVTLTLDGKAGTRVHGGYSELQGWQVLYKFPAVNQVSIVKLKAVVKNDQKSTTAGIDYKIVDDLTVATVWDNLTKNYMRAIPVDLQRYNDGTFSMPTRVVYFNGVESEPYLNGEFTDDYNAFFSYKAPRVFIPGLEGYYKLTYAGDALSQIRVTHFEILNTINFTGEKFYNELESVFGKPTSTKNTALEVVTTYNYPGFVIETHLDKQLMYTLITKK